jgi:LCP family protein required for cell wall assembly
MTAPHRGAWLVVLCLVTVAGCGVLATPPSESPESPRNTPGITARPEPTPARTRRPRPTGTPSPAPTLPPTAPPTDGEIAGLDQLLGTDGRLTMLLLGSDAAFNREGERIDTIMVATINPRNGAVAMASLPRDTVNVPTSAGNVFEPRINALLQSLEARYGNRKRALRRMQRAIAYAFDIEIDYYALVKFVGVERLIRAIAGVDVRLAAPLVDMSILKPRGLVLKRGKNHLTGRTALAFARTRHTDSDYARGARQQQLIIATVRKVLARGGDALPPLVSLASRNIETNLPFRAAPVLMELAERARLQNYRSFVLQPDTYAHAGSEQFTTELDIPVVRRMFDRFFGPVRN